MNWGVRHAVFSPGSRNAPLTVSFARNSGIKKWIIPDERAAGFIALGIAQEKKEPVVLCCTSGTALLNYAPAIAEAYYRQIPLLVLSADRPPELIDQRDGQTIRQFEVLKNHVKASVQLPTISSIPEAESYQELLVDAIRTSQQLPVGPVHINIPFREPFYPTPEQELRFDKITLPVSAKRNAQLISFEIPTSSKVLILVGQDEPDQETQTLLKEVSKQVPVVCAPLNNVSSGVCMTDAFISDQPELAPDLLITSGLSVLSKKLKLFLRKHSPKKHLHFDQAGIEVDTYQSNPELIEAPLKEALKNLSTEKADPNYLANWKQLETATQEVLPEFMKAAAFSESKATYQILEKLPSNCMLHVSNSMPVRYVDMLGVKKGIVTRSNRGTSGIDGCTSTALGNALVSDQPHILITGDLAFLYDRNAFFHNYAASNLRIIVMNNQGGGIFRLIQGPSNLPELEDYFETRHNRTAEYICAENQIDYLVARSKEDIADQWEDFMSEGNNAKLLEVFTDPETNQDVYKQLKSTIHERTNSLEKSS